ncbi:MAG TPA: FAD-dependent oxidoreductase [Steroidobacteraceae bacterium]|nr:FAD-dependent oxidoreductase [Steroidobacteraceae bacterium]
MSKARAFVLVGGGQSSVSAAQTLRESGFDGEIIIVGDESHAPYQRPPLSKEYLLGESTLEDIGSVRPAWYADNNVKLELGRRAVRIDRTSLDVELDDGRALKADAVLIATGGTPRRFPGADSESILYLRTLDDAGRIRRKLRPGLRVAIVGAGFIGSELAACARTLGAEVTLIEAMKTPLERVLGETIGAVCGSLHRENGVDLRCGVFIEKIKAAESGAVITTRDGGTIEADIVVVGIGIVPNVDLAKATEITVGNGIRVDEFCRTTARGIYAAGDVANHYHPLFDCRLRVEHFDNATRQGAVAAMNMLGGHTRYDDPHWFWSDQYGHSLQYVGHVSQRDDIVIRGSLEERSFVAFYLEKGKVSAAFGLNRGGDISAVKLLLSAGVTVDAKTLRDEDVDLGSLLDDGAGTQAAADASGRVPADGEFHRAARSGQVCEGGVRRIVVAGVELAVARLNGKVYALHNLCTHLACHLSSGKVQNGGLTCLCHGSVFDLATGEPINPPASKAVKTYPVRETDGQIYVAVK